MKKKAFSFHLLKGAFDRPFAVDVMLTKHPVMGLFEYSDRLIIMLEASDNTTD